jgi:ParB family chromosome partitioning protein
VAKQRFGTGRGLDALFSSAPEDVAVQPQQQPSANAEKVDEKAIPLLPIDSIIPNPRQPRRVFREDDPKLLELCASIKEHGLLQPIVVTPLDKLEVKPKADSWFGDDAPTSSGAFGGQEQTARYQIIAGERRWRASRLAGLKELPAVIKDVTQQQMLELALIENIQRADLNPIEEALAYQALVEEFGLTHENYQFVALVAACSQGTRNPDQPVGKFHRGPCTRLDWHYARRGSGAGHGAGHCTEPECAADGSVSRSH